MLPIILLNLCRLSALAFVFFGVGVYLCILTYRYVHTESAFVDLLMLNCIDVILISTFFRNSKRIITDLRIEKI